MSVKHHITSYAQLGTMNSMTPKSESGILSDSFKTVNKVSRARSMPRKAFAKKGSGGERFRTRALATTPIDFKSFAVSDNGSGHLTFMKAYAQCPVKSNGSSTANAQRALANIQYVYKPCP